MLRTSLLIVLALAACNEAPTLGAVTIGPEIPTTLDDLRLHVTDVRDINHRDEPVVEVHWQANGVAVPALDGHTVVPASYTAAGDLWSAKVIANDGRGTSVPRTVSMVIANLAPHGQVSINPDTPQPGDPIQAIATFADPDDDDLTLTWHWARDGQRTAFNTDTIPAGETHRDEVWTVSVVANDGTESSEPNILTVRIGNSLPTVHSVVIGPDNAGVADDLIATVSATDPDGDSISLRYSWLVDGESTDVSGGVFPAGLAQRGARVEVWVAPFDDYSDGEAVHAFSVIGNTAPIVAGAVIDIAEPTVLDTLSCSPEGVEDADNDVVSASYYWSVNGALRSSEPSFAGTQFSRSDVITCSILVDDGMSASLAVPSAPVVVGNAPPLLADILLAGDELRTGDAVNALLVDLVDPDGDAVEVSFTWSYNGEVISSEASLPANDWQAGLDLTVSVTLSDGFSVSAPLVRTFTVANTAPVIDSAELSGAPHATGELTASIQATDPDDDAVTFEYIWTVNGENVPVDGPTLPGSRMHRGDFVELHFTARDGSSATRGTLGPIIVGNAPPSIDAVTIDAPSAREGDVLNAVHTDAFDADGDVTTVAYTWSIDGQQVGTGAQFTVPAVGAGTPITVTAVPSDADGPGEPQTSVATFGVNEGPVLSSVEISPASDIDSRTVLVANWTATDAEDDALEAHYTWTVNGTALAVDTVSLPVWVWASKGDEIAVQVVVTDESSDSEMMTSDAIIVGNTAPVAPSITFSPSSPVPEQALTCAVESPATDEDEDPITLTFTWERDGEPWTGPVADGDNEGDTIPVEHVGTGETWLCQVVANDGTVDSSPQEVDEDVDHGDDAIIGQYLSQDYAIYRLRDIELDVVDPETSYAVACTDLGMSPVSCDPVTHGESFDASAYGAIALDDATFGCDVSRGVADLTGWDVLVSLHDQDGAGLCVEDCQSPPQTVHPLCATSR